MRNLFFVLSMLIISFVVEAFLWLIGKNDEADTF